MLFASRISGLTALDTFCRIVQAVTDDPEKSDHTKQEMLEGLANQLAREEWDALPVFAQPLGRRLAGGDCPPEAARDFLSAMRDDAVTALYPSLGALLAHARRAAASRGRMMLAIAGEDGGGAADSFFTAAQLLDYVAGTGRYASALGRIYLPQDWLGELGVTPLMLAQPESRPEVIQLLQWLLRVAEEQLCTAEGFAGSLKTRRLRHDAQKAHEATLHWAAELAEADILARSVAAPVALRRFVPGW